MIFLHWKQEASPQGMEKPRTAIRLPLFFMTSASLSDEGMSSASSENQGVENLLWLGSSPGCCLLHLENSSWMGAPCRRG